MKIYHYHVLKVLDSGTNIELSLKKLDEKLNKLLDMEKNDMKTAQELLAAATEQKSVVASVVAAIKALQEQVAAIPDVPADVQAAIDATFEAVTGDTAALAQAITVNTPVEVPAVVEEAPPVE